MLFRVYTNKHEYILGANTEQERASWIEAITAAAQWWVRSSFASGLAEGIASAGNQSTANAVDLSQDD